MHTTANGETVAGASVLVWEWSFRGHRPWTVKFIGWNISTYWVEHPLYGIREVEATTGILV